MTDDKRQIIQQLLQEYDIQSATDIQDALKDLLGGTIKEIIMVSRSVLIHETIILVWPPALVTVDNIRDTRFSRNPKISRVMTKFGYVRELNESVKKIYSDMSEAELPVPEYSDSANSVRLVLENNIDIRTAYRKVTSEDSATVTNEAKNEAKKNGLTTDGKSLESESGDTPGE